MCEIDVIFKMFIFPENIRTKWTKIYFGFLSSKDDPHSYKSQFTMENKVK